MLGRCTTTALAALVAAPVVLAAEKLPIDGPYGTESGCVHARTNDYSEDDTVKLLTPEGLETMVTSCTFTKVAAIAGPGFAVSFACGQEGSGPEDNYESTANIIGNPQQGYRIDFADGNQWEGLKKCK